MRRAAAALILASLASPAFAGDDARLAAVLDGVVRPDEPGLAALVRIQGKTVFARGYGLRDLRSRARVDERTGFRLASVTKSLTATAVMLLVREGKLRYDAP
jgi:CubicO group peptidase (beta-lactamase class C family)